MKQQLDTVRVTLPLKRTFATSKGSAENKTNIITILNNRYSGEACGSVSYGPDVPVLEAGLKEGENFLKSVKAIDLATIEQLSDLDIPKAATAALVGMAVNFVSGETKRYPWEVLSLGTPVGIRSSFTIGIDEPDRMVSQIQSCPYPIIKIKLGSKDDSRVLAALDAIDGKEIRVDANGAWSCAVAEEMIYHLVKRGVTVIEQPTDIEHISDWPHLKGKHEDVELIVDEGLNRIEDYHQFKAYIDGVNIKMEKCGGIIEGRKIAEAAHEDGKKVMLGCMVESSVGIAQSVYMSSLADYFDLDGPLLLESDIAEGIRYDREVIEVDREIIGGPKLIRSIIERYSK